MELHVSLTFLQFNRATLLVANHLWRGATLLPWRRVATRGNGVLGLGWRSALVIRWRLYVVVCYSTPLASVTFHWPIDTRSGRESWKDPWGFWRSLKGSRRDRRERCPWIHESSRRILKDRKRTPVDRSIILKKSSKLGNDLQRVLTDGLRSLRILRNSHKIFNYPNKSC